MTIEFYFLGPSPPCRVVWMVFKALKLDFEPKYVNILEGEQYNPEYLAINPRGKIPAIKDGNFILAESRAISTYLCNQYEKGDDSTRLYPVDPKARGIVDQVLYCSEVTYDQVQSYAKTGSVIFKGQKPDEGNLEAVHKALALGEDYLSKNEYMAGDHLTLADLFMLSSVLVLELPGFNDFAKYPKTVAWMEKMKALPYYDECNKEAIDSFKQLYQEALKKLGA